MPDMVTVVLSVSDLRFRDTINPVFQTGFGLSNFYGAIFFVDFDSLGENQNNGPGNHRVSGKIRLPGVG